MRRIKVKLGAAVGVVLAMSLNGNYFDDLLTPAYDFNGNGLYDSASEPRTQSNSWGGADSTYDAGTAPVDQFM